MTSKLHTDSIKPMTKNGLSNIHDGEAESGPPGNQARYKTGTLNISDGHEVFYRVWQSESSKPVGLVHINHGMAEHSRRYESLALALNSAGFHVFAHDHRGHGYSTKEPEALGHFSGSGGWSKLLADIKLIQTHFKQTYPELPLVMLGHSMGSFISLNYAQQLLGSNAIDALILSGSTLNFTGKDIGLKILSKVEKARLGKTGRSRVIEEVTFGAFNRNFKPNRTQFDWLTRDESVIESYIKDPLSGFRCTNETWYQLADALLNIFQPKQLKKIPSQLPIYLFYGDLDPLGGKCGNKRLEKKLKAAGLKDITKNGYPNARHEMINELNKEEVIQDLLTWLRSRITER